MIKDYATEFKGKRALVNSAGAVAPKLPGIEAISDQEWIDSHRLKAGRYRRRTW
jgi:hypothetical protein